MRRGVGDGKSNVRSEEIVVVVVQMLVSAIFGALKATSAKSLVTARTVMWEPITLRWVGEEKTASFVRWRLLMVQACSVIN